MNIKRLVVNDDMREASDIESMADNFHPAILHGTNVHNSTVLDAIEAALLWGAGRASKRDFIQALEDLGDWEELS